MNNFPKYPARRETAIAGSGTPAPAERLRLIGAPVLEGFNSDSSFGVRRHVQSPDTDQLKTSEPPGGTTGEISFGPFRLLPAQFSSAGRRQTGASRESRSAFTYYLA